MAIKSAGPARANENRSNRTSVSSHGDLYAVLLPVSIGAMFYGGGHFLAGDHAVLGMGVSALGSCGAIASIEKALDKRHPVRGILSLAFCVVAAYGGSHLAPPHDAALHGPLSKNSQNETPVAKNAPALSPDSLVRLREKACTPDMKNKVIVYKSSGKELRLTCK